MIRSLYTAASGMLAQQYNMDAISHNLANVNTTGYKKGRAEFQDLLYTQIAPPTRGGQDKGISVGQGARLSSMHRIMSGGTLQVTGNDYDVAISGDGFFQVQRADGSFGYTRDGSFHLDADRHLVTANGDLVMGADGPITIPPEASNLSIGADGTITYQDLTKAATTQAQDPAAQAQATVRVGQIQLATFPNPSGLEAIGDNLWVTSANSGNPTMVNPGEQESGRLSQGSLEGSNVQAVEEMVNMILAQRAYEINSKVVQSADDMLGMANNLRRG